MAEGAVARELRVEFTANVSDLKNKIQGIQSDMKKFAPAATSMQNAYAKSFRAMGSVSDSLKRQMSALEAELKRTGEVSAPSMDGMEASLRDAEEAAATLKSVMDELDSSLKEMGSMKLETPEYSQLAASLQTAQQQLARYEYQQARMSAVGVKENTQAWKSLQFNIDEAVREVETLSGRMRDMETNGTAFTAGSDTSQYQTAAFYAQQAAAAYAEVQQTAEAAAARVQELSQATADASTAADGLGQEMDEAAGRTGGLRTALESIGAAAAGPISTLKSKLSEVASTIGSGLKTAATTGAKAIGNLYSRLLGIRKGASSAGSGLNSMVKSIRNIGLVSVGLKICSGLFGQLRSIISQCVSADESMSASVSELKSGLSNALSPAISVVINLLQKLLPYLIGIADAVASLITNIFGKGWTSVSTSASSAASSIDSVTDATSGAAAAQEAYNKTLAGFDEITKLDDSSSSSGGSGGGGSSSTTAEDTEGIAGLLPTWLSELTEQISALLEEQDFSGIGELLAGKFGDLVDYLDAALTSDEFQSKLQNALDGITEGINGFLEGLTFDEAGPSVSARLGDLIGDAIGTVLSSLDTLLTDIEWYKLGLAIAQFVNGGLESLQQQECNLGQVLGDWFNAAFSYLDGIFGNLDWSLIGETIAANINSALETADFGAAAETISETIVGLLETLTTTLQELDYEQLADDISEFFANIDWMGLLSGIGDALGAAFAGILTLLWELLKNGLESLNEKLPTWLQPVLNTIIGWGDNITESIQNAFGLSDDETLTVTADLSVGLKKSLDWDTDAWTALQNGGYSLGSALNVSVLKDKWNTQAYEAATLEEDDGRSITIEAGIVKASDWDEDAFTITTQEEDQKTIWQTLKVGVQKAGTWVKDAFTAAMTAGGTVARTLVTSCHIGSWDSTAYSAANITSGTSTRTIQSNVLWDNYNSTAWSAANLSTGSVTRTVTSKVTQGSWNADAYTAAKMEAKTVTRELKQKVAQGSWDSDAYKAAKMSGDVTRKLSQKVQKDSWDGTAWKAANMSGDTINKALKVAVTATGITSTLTALLAASGGVITSMGVRAFAEGGIVGRGGSWWGSIPKYGTGTSDAHGTMFVAGEAGPEIVGHVGGRTEVLNASQLASVMHTAITDGMNQFVSWFQALNTNMITCANGVIAAVSTAAAGAMGDLVAWADEKWQYSGVAVPQEAQYGAAAGSSAGLVQAIAEGLAAAAEARSEGREQDMTVNVYIGGKQLTSQVVNDVNRITRATGVCPIYV